MAESFAMKGGAGPASYTQNSKFQEKQIALAKALLTNGIQQNLTIVSNPSVFQIADLGCSVGPNTFFCVQIIIGAVESKFKANGIESKTPEFHVYFNDQVSNDFNTLFRNLPSSRTYTAAGVPGSFHARLFPKASINFFHSAYALHWLTMVPDDVKNPEKQQWNEGRITYAESAPEIGDAFKDQFRRDMWSFFDARSKEMVDDGLLAILIPCRPDGTDLSHSSLLKGFECMGDALRDMIEEGLVEKELVDTFNLPIFIPTASEVTEIASEVKGLSVEMVKVIDSPSPLSTPAEIAFCTGNLRAVFENILSKHFGSAVTNMIFEKLPQKLEKFGMTPFFSYSQKVENLFLLIKKLAV